MKKLTNIKSIEEFINEAEDLSMKMDHYMFFENLKTIKSNIKMFIIINFLE